MLYAKGLCRCGKILRANPKARLLTTRRVQGWAKKTGPQIARIFQPSRGRSGKQDRNQFTKLGAHFLAHPFMNNPPHTFSLHISQTMLFLPTLCPSHLTAELSNGEKLGGNCLSPLSSFLSYSPLRLSLVRRPSVRLSVRRVRSFIFKGRIAISAAVFHSK